MKNREIDVVLTYGELESIRVLLRKKNPARNSLDWYLQRKIERLLALVDARGAAADL